MNETCFDLGSGKTRGTGIGQKAQYLDRAVRSGLPVPRGLIVRAEATLEGQLMGFLDEDPEDGAITCSRPQELADWLSLPTFGSLVRVIPAFSMEDNGTACDIHFTHKYHINLNDAEDIARALCDVWSSAHAQEGDNRRDVIILEMVDQAIKGKAFTQRDFEDDYVQVEWDEREIRGQATTLLIPKLRRFEGQQAAYLPDWAQRLQKLLRRIRAVFGADDWVIEWADDGQQCYLLQITRIHDKPERDEAFIPAREPVLFDLPDFFMAEVVRSSEDRLINAFRQYDDTFPRQRPLMSIYQQRPYVNFSLLCDLIRNLGLSTKRINHGSIAHQQHGIRFVRVIGKTLRGTLPRIFFAQRGIGKALQRAQQIVDERLSKELVTWDDHLRLARWLYTTHITRQAPFYLMTALTEPERLQRFPDKVIALHQTWQTHIAQGFEQLQQSMLAKAEALVTADILPDVDAIWMMTFDELRQLDGEWQPDSEFFEKRQTEIAALKKESLPDLLHRHQDEKLEGRQFARQDQKTNPVSQPIKNTQMQWAKH